MDSLSQLENHWKTLSIKILNQECQGHDEALKSLERISSAVFFEMDLRYDMQFGLVQRRLAGRRSRSHDIRDSGPEMLKAPQMPRLPYPHNAVSLYLHGQSLTLLPLQQFLTFYQAIEYHFPMFVRRDLLARLRRKLRDHGFNSENDAYLHRLIEMMENETHVRYPNAQEQLRVTLMQCIDATQLMDYLKWDSFRWEAICNKSTIKGVYAINEKDKPFSLMAQIAKRIHQIRCAIVHAKEDGGSEAVPMLLPASPEARNLWHDIDVVRYLAQKVIIEGTATQR